MHGILYMCIHMYSGIPLSLSLFICLLWAWKYSMKPATIMLPFLLPVSEHVDIPSGVWDLVLGWFLGDHTVLGIKLESPAL